MTSALGYLEDTLFVTNLNIHSCEVACGLDSIQWNPQLSSLRARLLFTVRETTEVGCQNRCRAT